VIIEPITRRNLLGGAAKGGLALSASGLIAACGSGSSSTTPVAATKSTATARHGGTLTVGMTGGSSSDTLDPNSPVNNTDFARIAALYDGLVWQDAQTHPYPRFAEEFVPNKDATVWTIRLRKGMLFHDGREATADDLIFSLRRVVNPKAPGASSFFLRGMETSAIRKVDRYTVSVPFSAPYSTFFLSMDGTDTMYLLPVGFDPKRPIGTGPFKFVSFTPGQRSVFARWEHYWNQPLPYVDQLVLVDYTDETSQVNALLSGAVDAVNNLSQDVISEVSSGGKKVVVSPGGGWNPFTMRVDQAPFDDVRVRQAFRLMVDRPKMMQIVFGGHGTLGNDLFGIWDPDYDPSMPQRAQDIEQAKHLLKAAGREGLTVQLVTSDIAQGVVNMAQVFAQDAASAGVTVNLRKVTPTEFYGPNYLKWTFAQDYWYYAPYLSQVAQATIPGAVYNETHFDNPRYNALYKQVRSTLDLSLRRELVHEMQMIEWNEGGYVIPLFPPVIDGYADHVNATVPSKTGASFNDFDFEHLWLS
jgi:peptide/nickel transport system substrate-binding protein